MRAKAVEVSVRAQVRARVRARVRAKVRARVSESGRLRVVEWIPARSLWPMLRR